MTNLFDTKYIKNINMCQKNNGYYIVVPSEGSTHKKIFAYKLIMSAKSCPCDCRGFSHSLQKCQYRHIY